ncbi:MAG TPA: general secretion pathway protein GspM [Comamonadaceae bacterium]|uniref:type II secretion system protein GspM n=1 Tax=Pulveribacter sp. TaxID=2678893 RepID=UPI000ED4BD72|nr:type II secretion system protein GspM [Pulveribacter sp.]HCL87675.1 general secretion pathway protein GspM [Comamonadaceae bacterium]
MNPRLQRDRWVLVATLMVLLLPLLAAGMLVYQKHRWATERLAELEPRYARLAGILQAQAELEAANQRASEELAIYFHPPEKALNQTGNEVLQQVRDTLSAGGLRVGSSQVLPPKTDQPGLDRIQVTIKAEGELLALQTAMAGLKAIRPAVFVDNLAVNVMGTPRVDAPQPLSIQLEISAWRIHP